MSKDSHRRSFSGRSNRRPVASTTRRSFLAGSVGAAVSAASGIGSKPAIAQSGGVLSQETLGTGITRFAGNGGNALLVLTEAGGVLVDSGAPADAAAIRSAAMEQLGGRKLDALINTHWHLEHTGGNDEFGRDGVRIVAHENTRLWMGTEYYVDWQNTTYTPRDSSALPTDTFYSHHPQPLRIESGAAVVEYGHLREAHTDGDVYVYFRDVNVLVTGGAVSAGAYPVLDYATGGWIGGLEDATRQLLALADSETRFVPQSGPVQRRTHLEAQLEMVTTVRRKVEDLMRQGRSAEEMLAAGVTDEFDDYWGSNAERFIRNVYGGLWWQGRLDGSL